MSKQVGKGNTAMAEGSVNGTPEIVEEVTQEPFIVESRAISTGSTLYSLNEKLASALAIDTESLYTSIDTASGKVDVMKKTYQFANPVGKRDSVTIYDSAIIESMEKITHALHGKAILTYAICKEFSKIAESGKLKNMGFNTIADFGKAVYGLETSTVNHYARIGSTFINDDYTVKAGLPDLSVSHFIELSSTVGEDGDVSPIIELYTNGTLVDGMSTKKIRETLKSLSSGNAIEDKKEESSKSGNPNTGESILNDSEVNELKANFDSQVVIGKIISGCSIIEQLFGMLTENEIKAIGYGEHLDAVKAIAKALL